MTLHRIRRAGRTLAGAALLACTAAADGIVDGVLTLDAPADAGRTLAASLAARNLTTADLSSVTQLVVACGGVVTSDAALTGWSGDLRICAPNVFEVTAVGALGTADGTIFIENGGQLKMALAEKETWPQTKKTCYFEGAGPDGNGALYSTSAEHVVEHCLWPYRLVMTGDATWTADTRSGADLTTAELDMNGHTLHYGVRGRFHGVTITHPGHIVHTAGTMLIQGGCDFGGDASNTITVKNEAIMNFWGNPGTTPWTAIFEPGASLYPGAYTSEWQGPVVLNAVVPVYRWISGATMILYGQIRGDGGFMSRDGEYGEGMTLSLRCPTNTFQGGVALRSCTLDLPVNGALPATGAALALTNSSVTFSEGIAYDLPAAVFCGTGTVSRGLGTWRGSVTKEGDGELVYASGVGSDLLDVKGGRVRLARDDGGLYRAVVRGTKADNAALAAFEDAACPTNGWATFPDYSYPARNGSWKSYMSVFYAGYLWNRSSEDAVWTFAACIDDRARLFLNGQEVLTCRTWDDLAFAQVTLRPGANRFEWRMYNAEGGAGGSNGGGSLDWDTAKGLAYHVGATDSKSPADFTAFTADDAGTLFTLTDGTADDLRRLLPTFRTVRLAAETVFDLGAFDYAVEELAGAGRVENGALTVTKRLTVPAAEAKAGAHLTVAGTLTFGADAQIDVDAPEALTHVSEVTVAEATAIAGRPTPSAALKAANWTVVRTGGTLTLRRAGLTLVVR